MRLPISKPEPLSLYDDEHVPGIFRGSRLGQSLPDNLSCRENENGCTFLVSSDGITWVGNTTLCIDTDFASRLVSSPGETDSEWWELWLSTGLLAQILIKFVIVNYGIALFRWADPLSTCGGQCLWPPHSLFRQTSDQAEHGKGGPERRSSSTCNVLQEFVFGSSPKNEPPTTNLQNLRKDNEMHLRVIARNFSLGSACEIFALEILFSPFHQKKTKRTDKWWIPCVLAVVVVIAVMLLALFNGASKMQ